MRGERVRRMNGRDETRRVGNDDKRDKIGTNIENFLGRIYLSRRSHPLRMLDK